MSLRQPSKPPRLPPTSNVIVPVCICAHPINEGWPMYLPVGGYVCAKCHGWKSSS